MCCDLAALNKYVCKYHSIPVTPRALAYVWVEFGLVFFIGASFVAASSSAVKHRFLLCGGPEETLFDWGLLAMGDGGDGGGGGGGGGNAMGFGNLTNATNATMTWQ